MAQDPAGLSSGRGSQTLPGASAAALGRQHQAPPQEPQPQTALDQCDPGLPDPLRANPDAQTLPRGGKCCPLGARGAPGPHPARRGLCPAPLPHPPGPPPCPPTLSRHLVHTPPHRATPNCTGSSERKRVQHPHRPETTSQKVPGRPSPRSHTRRGTLGGHLPSPGWKPPLRTQTHPSVANQGEGGVLSGLGENGEQVCRRQQRPADRPQHLTGTGAACQVPGLHH